MNNLKKLFTDNIVDPAAESRSSTIINGIAVSVNEKNNTCKVKYTNHKGINETRDGVSVFIYNKSIIDWFPTQNEKVLLQERDRVLYIIGPANGQDYSRIRSEIKLQNDVFSETFIGGIGGYLF